MNDSQSDSDKRHPVVAWRDALLAGDPPHTLPATARLVGIGLSMHATWKLVAYPAAATVAARCNLSERAVRRGFELLEAAGWIVAGERGGVKGGRRTTVWTLTTPEPLSEVTPERGSEVHSDDPGQSDRAEPLTPEPQSTTPERGSDELEELGTEELERDLTPAELAHALVARHPEEAALAVEAAADRWGATRVHALVAAYATSGKRFIWASDLARRIDLDAEATSVRVAPAAARYCTACGNSGMVMPVGAKAATRCECNPGPTIAEAKVIG